MHLEYRGWEEWDWMAIPESQCNETLSLPGCFFAASFIVGSGALTKDDSKAGGALITSRGTGGDFEDLGCDQQTMHGCSF